MHALRQNNLGYFGIPGWISQIVGTGGGGKSVLGRPSSLQRKGQEMKSRGDTIKWLSVLLTFI